MLRGCFAHEDALLSLVSALAALRRPPVAVKVPQTRSGLEERQLHAHTPTNPAVHMAAVLRARAQCARYSTLDSSGLDCP